MPLTFHERPTLVPVCTNRNPKRTFTFMEWQLPLCAILSYESFHENALLSDSRRHQCRCPSGPPTSWFYKGSLLCLDTLFQRTIKIKPLRNFENELWPVTMYRQGIFHELQIYQTRSEGFWVETIVSAQRCGICVACWEMEFPTNFGRSQAQPGTILTAGYQAASGGDGQEVYLSSRGLQRESRIPWLECYKTVWVFWILFLLN